VIGMNFPRRTFLHLVTGAVLALQHDQLILGARHSLLSRRLFDLYGEVNSARKKHRSTTTIVAETYKIFDTHGHENAISHSPREVELE
jgi:hypothetical protein